MDTNGHVQTNAKTHASLTQGLEDHMVGVGSSTYEPLASEYYAPHHITSRNFDSAASAWFRTNQLKLPEGYVLDLGAGRGAVQAYCGAPRSRIIQADLSSSMLTLNAREPSRARVKCDALDLPFAHDSFAVVAAFLFDPFNRPPLERETFRVLKSGGLFIGTLPHSRWGRTLRSLRLLHQDKTRFLLQSGEYILRDSYLTEDVDLREHFAAAGYRRVKSLSLPLPRDVKAVSPDRKSVV